MCCQGQSNRKRENCQFHVLPSFLSLKELPIDLIGGRQANSIGIGFLLKCFIFQTLAGEFIGNGQFAFGPRNSNAPRCARGGDGFDLERRLLTQPRRDRQLDRTVLAPGRQLGFVAAQPAQFWPTIRTTSPRETAPAFPGSHNCLPTGHDAFIPGLILRFRSRQASSSFKEKA